VQIWQPRARRITNTQNATKPHHSEDSSLLHPAVQARLWWQTESPGLRSHVSRPLLIYCRSPTQKKKEQVFAGGFSYGGTIVQDLACSLAGYMEHLGWKWWIFDPWNWIETRDTINTEYCLINPRFRFGVWTWTRSCRYSGDVMKGACNFRLTPSKLS